MNGLLLFTPIHVITNTFTQFLRTLNRMISNKIVSLRLEVNGDGVVMTLAVKKVEVEANYEAFFAAVATRPQESYEKLMDLLPSVRETHSSSDAIVVGPTSGMHAKPVIHQVHPLKKEWLDAADAEFDDVPEEVGDWVDVEDLDDDGIPVVSGITRTSSACILDAPGAVQVDNFTEEEAATAALISSKFFPSPSPPAAAPLKDQGLPVKPVEGNKPASVSPQPLIMTLEDEIKKMKASGLHQAAMVALDHFYPPSSSLSSSKGQARIGGSLDGMEELDFMRKGSWEAAMTSALSPPPSTLRSSAANEKQRGGPSLVEEEEDESQPIMAAEGPEPERDQNSKDLPPSLSSTEPFETTSRQKQKQTLPGECLATDSGVDAAEVEDPFDSDLLLEDMGLKVKKEEEKEEEGIEHLDLTNSDAKPSYPLPAHEPSNGQSPPVTVVNVPSSSSTGPSAEDDRVTFEAVEKFSIDPDFDYDNVKLTPRGFPYNLRGPNPFPFAKKP